MHTVDSFFYASTCNINSVILPILSNRESIKSQAQTLSIIYHLVHNSLKNKSSRDFEILDEGTASRAFTLAIIKNLKCKVLYCMGLYICWQLNFFIL